MRVAYRVASRGGLAAEDHNLYAAVTGAAFFGVVGGDGKILGVAGYGKAAGVETVFVFEELEDGDAACGWHRR